MTLTVAVRESLFYFIFFYEDYDLNLWDSNTLNLLSVVLQMMLRVKKEVTYE